jgi:ADP-heptose:LPS heptosyltransferase
MTGSVASARQPLMPRRIAILRALQLGDLLLAVPAFRSLQAGFPDAEITLIGLPWAERFVHRFACYLDRFVEFAGYPGLAEVPVHKARVEDFLAEQRGYGYDLVIQMHGSGRTSTPLALALEGRMTAGYYEGDRPGQLAVGAPYPDRGSEIIRNLELSRLLGCPDRGTRLEFPLLPADHREAASLLSQLSSGGRPWIGIHPGARPSARRWLPSYFAAVGDALADRYGAQLVVTGGPGEERIVADVVRRMRCRPLNLAGATSLGGLAAIIARLDLFISNDTGPAHLAVALDTPSVTIFGPADPDRWAPLHRQRHPVVRRAVACSPCGYVDCPIDHRCLRLIEPEVVLETAESLLRSAVQCA